MVTWKQEAQQSWDDKKLVLAEITAEDERLSGRVLGELLFDILGERFAPTSGEFSDLGVTFALRHDGGGRNFVVILSPPNEEDMVSSLEDVGRVLEDRGL